MKSPLYSFFILLLFLFTFISCKSGNEITSENMSDFDEDFKIVGDVLSSVIAESLSSDMITEILKDEEAYKSGRLIIVEGKKNGKTKILVKPSMNVDKLIANVKFDIGFGFENFENEKYSLTNDSSMKFIIDFTMNMSNNTFTKSYMSLNGTIKYKGTKNGKCVIVLEADDFFRDKIDKESLLKKMNGYMTINGKKIDFKTLFDKFGDKDIDV